MSTILKSFDWSYVSKVTDKARARNYPWDAWFDGRIHQLEPGVDFDGPAVSLAGVIRTSANRRGVKVRVRIIEDDNIVIQKHADAVVNRGVTKSPSLRSLKAAAQEYAPPIEHVNGNGHKPNPAKVVEAPAPVKVMRKRHLAKV